MKNTNIQVSETQCRIHSTSWQNRDQTTVNHYCNVSIDAIALIAGEKNWRPSHVDHTSNKPLSKQFKASVCHHECCLLSKPVFLCKMDVKPFMWNTELPIRQQQKRMLSMWSNFGKSCTKSKSIYFTKRFTPAITMFSPTRCYTCCKTIATIHMDNGRRQYWWLARFCMRRLWRDGAGLWIRRRRRRWGTPLLTQ